AENGPSGLGRYSLPQRTESNFGLEGWLVMMVGNCVPYRGRHFAAKEERLVWGRRQAEFAMNAQRGFDVRQALACVRDPRWRWNASGINPSNATAPVPRRQ